MMGNGCKMTWHCLNVRMSVLDHETTMNGGYMAVQASYCNCMGMAEALLKLVHALVRPTSHKRAS